MPLEVMDHIEEVTDPAYPPLRIPCLSLDEYDQLDWASYPERAGWSKDRILSGDLSQHPRGETAAFLQNWLYFGVLWVVLGENGTKANYVKTDPTGDHGIITTELLDQHIDERMLELKELAQGDQSSTQVKLQDIETCLMTVSKLCIFSTCSDDPRTGYNVWPLSVEIDLSVRHLGEYLCAALHIEWNFSYPCPFANLSFLCAYLPISRMIEEGRCPSERDMVSHAFSSTSAYYATQLKRPKETSRLDHSNCSDTLCAARQLDENTYCTQHTEDGCICTHLGPSVDEVVSIIRCGRIPLVSIETVKTSPYLKIKVEPFKPGKRFIALSHVWSDGLGNPFQNTLPRCQFLRIKTILDGILSQFNALSLINMGALNTLSKKFHGSSLLFWMDTLCIPVQEEHREVRSLAIKSMKSIYEGAFRVLVLDRELQASPQGVSTEAFMRISLSPWMRRLWTLQEGVCAQRLYIKFADGILDVQAEYEKNSNNYRKLGGWLDPQKRQISFRLPFAQARSLYWGFLTLRVNVIDRPDQKMIGMKRTIISPSVDQDIRKRCNAIMQAYMAALYRSTSRKEDQFICMASLIGWNLSLLHGLPFQKRMYALLSTETHLPQGLLFMMGPRMKEPGWTWAVGQFGSSKAVNITVPLGDIAPGTVTERGFAVQYPGLALPSSYTLEKLRYVHVYAQLDNGAIVRFQIQQADQSMKKNEVAEDNTENLDSNTKPDSQRRNFYVIFWDHTGTLLSWVPMMAAVVSASEAQNVCNNGRDTERVCKFEFVAMLEILGRPSKHDQEKRDVNEDAHLVKGTWVVQ